MLNKQNSPESCVRKRVDKVHELFTLTYTPKKHRMLVHPRRAAITSPTVGRARFGCLANETSYLVHLIFTQLETLPFL